MKPIYQQQRTIKKEGAMSGTGLHTGAGCTVYFKPAPANTGVRFLNKGRSIDPVVPEASERCTSIGNNGQEICLLLKTHPDVGHIPVIICSAYVQKDADLSAWGCDDVIAKPFGLEELTDKVNNLILG